MVKLGGENLKIVATQPVTKNQKILTLELQADLDLSNFVGQITKYESPKFMQEISEQMWVNAQAVITGQFAGIRNSSARQTERPAQTPVVSGILGNY